MTRQATGAQVIISQPCNKTRKIFPHFFICPFSQPHESFLGHFCTQIKPILNWRSPCKMCNDPRPFPLTEFSMLEPSILCMALSHRLHHTSDILHGCDTLRGSWWSVWHYWGHQYLAPGSHLLTLSQVSRVTPSWHVMKLVTCFRSTVSRPGRCLWSSERVWGEENPCTLTLSSGRWTTRTKSFMILLIGFI